MFYTNQKYILLVYIVIFLNTININYANVGGLTHKPSVIGNPITWEFTNISIESEDLELKFFEENGKKYCSFTAIYYLTSDTIGEIPISAIFYGLNASNINVYYNSNLLKTEIDSAEFEMIDDIIHESARPVIHRPVINWDKLNKKGFKFIYKSDAKNVLKVTGLIELTPDKLWYGFTTSAIYTKHPFLNKDLSEGNEALHYLITPIETWKSVGEIRIKVEYPKDWQLRYRNQDIAQKLISKDNEMSIENIVLGKELPEAFSVIVMKKKKLFYIGGLNLGFSKIGKDDFATRFGWEFGLNHGFLVNTLFAIEYETDFENYNQISFSVIPTTPWFAIIVPNIGLGIGVPVRFVDGNVYSGIKLRTDFSWGLFNISLNMDYLPGLKNSGFYRNYYGFTL